MTAQVDLIFGEWLFGKLLAIMVWCACLAHPRAVCQTRNSPAPANIERARNVLTEGFDSGDYTVRVEAITAAGLVGRNETLLTRLQGFLEDNNVQVRLATVHALADVDTRARRALLRKTLQGDKTPEVSFAAAKALALMEDPEGKAALLEVYRGERKSRSNLIKEEERNLFDEFHSVPSALMFVVTKGVGYVPVPGAGEGVSAMISLLREHGLSDRARVIMILARSKNPQSSNYSEVRYRTSTGQFGPRPPR
jgi:HEAT repeat protein